MKILITGSPATGKTCIGNYLKDHKQYDHFDVEAEMKIPPNGSWEGRMKKFVGEAGENKVVTWGFAPGIHDRSIHYLQRQGYRMFLFDGDKTIVRKRFFERGQGSGIDELEIQLGRIDTMKISDFCPCTKVDPYHVNGAFRDRDEIIAELLQH